MAQRSKGERKSSTDVKDKEERITKDSETHTCSDHLLSSQHPSRSLLPSSPLPTQPPFAIFRLRAKRLYLFARTASAD